MEPSHCFDLQIKGSLSGVAVEVLDSPAGQTAAPAVQPCSAGFGQPDHLSTVAGLQSAGAALWRCSLGAPGVEGLWRASLAMGEPEGVLLLRLAIASPELAALPWELLFDESRGRFLALDGRTPVARYLRLSIAPLPWPVDRPLRLLFTGASPAGLSRLDVAGEGREIAAACAPLIAAGRWQSRAVPEGATVPALLAALREGVDLWHFAGHGSDDGLIFCDARGKAALADAATLGQMLAGEGVRLAVLNACRAGAGGGQPASVAGALARAGIPAVIAMQADITSGAAAAFAAAFYDAIAGGQGVDRATTAARKAIWAAGTTEWWLPALFMRTPDGHIWQEPAQTPVPPATTIEVRGDRNIVIAGKVGGAVNINQ